MFLIFICWKTWLWLLLSSRWTTERLGAILESSMHAFNKSVIEHLRCSYVLWRQTRQRRGFGSTREDSGCCFMLQEGGKRRKTACSPSLKDNFQTLHTMPEAIAQNWVTQPHLAAREHGKCRLNSGKPCAQLLWGSGVSLKMQRMDIGKQSATTGELHQ